MNEEESQQQIRALQQLVGEMLARIQSLELHVTITAKDDALLNGPHKPVFIVKRDDAEPLSWTEQAIKSDKSVVPFEDGRSAAKDDAGELLDLEDLDGGENCCAALEVDGVKDGSLVSRYLALSSAGSFIAIKITSATPIAGGANRWTYGWIEQIVFQNGQYQDKPAGRTSGSTGWMGFNVTEANNSATGLQGNGSNVTDWPVGAAMQPAPPGIGVFFALKKKNCNGAYEMHFEHDNLVRSTCSPGAGGG